MVDENRRVAQFNARFAELWQLPEDVLKTNADDRLLGHVLSSLAEPEEFLAKVTHLYEHLHESSRDEIRFRDGRIIDRFSAPVRTRQGKTFGRVWFFRDVTASRRAEIDLKRANSFLDSIVENIPDMIFVKEAETLSFERFNRAGEELLGMKRHELLGKTDYDLFPKEQADKFTMDDRATLAAGAVVDIAEEPLVTADGTRWLHTKKIPVVDDEGCPKYLLGISQDITDQKAAQELLEKTNEELERRVRERTTELSRANDELRQEIAERERAEKALTDTEAQLRHSQRMEAVGRLAGGVAHDFNNMLAVILSHCDLLIDDATPGASDTGELEQIKEAASRAAVLTQQLLAYSRQQILEPVVLDMNTVVGEMERMLRRLIGEDIDLRADLTATPAVVMADAGQIAQVIMNLGVNARDAMPEGGTLTLETSLVELDQAFVDRHVDSSVGPHVCLTVTDTGSGMSEETLGRIFEPFFTTKQGGQGTGLGLATVYGIVRQSGGHIRVESTEGEGTRFQVYFPRISVRVPARRPRKPTASGLNGTETILLVEDEPMVRRATRKVLRRYGYTVIEAEHAERALELLARTDEPVHLVLTDVVMPGMSGWSLAESLRELRPETKIVFMSGYTEQVRGASGRPKPGASFIQKPFTPPVLLETVRAVLESDRTVTSLSRPPTSILVRQRTG